MSEHTIQMTVNSDENGFFDRECPNEDCLFTFKVDMEDWKTKVSDDHVYCPRCGHDAPSDQWWTQEQIETIKENAQSYALGLVHDEARRAFKSLERKTKNKSIQITYVPGPRPTHLDLPIEQSGSWATEIVCGSCGTRFSVIGAAYFCPCCGKDLTISAALDSLDSYERRIDSLESIRKTYEMGFSKDEAARQVDSLREATLGECVSTYESFAKGRYQELTGGVPKGNLFQRVTDGSNIFEKATGASYETFIGEEDLRFMDLMFNRRHLFTHNNGKVDQVYLDKTGDPIYQLGERIVIHDSEVLHLIGVLRELIEGLLEAGSFE